MRSTPDPKSPSVARDSIADQAAIWLARRDRGFTAGEQDSYLEWLRRDSRHPAAIARLEVAWRALDQLQEWRPVHSDRPNPDLLAVPRRRPVWKWLAPLAVAAALVFGFVVQQGFSLSEGTTRVVRHSEVRALPDGSVVELNTGAEITVEFSGNERLVRMVRGEAHFTVAKDSARPFIVVAGNVRLRAVGTVFNVRLAGDTVDVLVTEGKVRIDPPKPADLEGVLNAAMLEAGERTQAHLCEPTPVPPTVVSVSVGEIEETLSWQGLRLQFDETPLEEAIAQFNRHGASTLVIADRELARLRIGGNFRADSADAFVRLLESGFNVRVELDERGRRVLHAVN